MLTIWEVGLAAKGKLFVVTETKQRSGLYSLFHLPDLNVPFDLASKTKWALLVSAHDASISIYIVAGIFPIHVVTVKVTNDYCWMSPRTWSGHMIVGSLYTLIIVVGPTLTLTMWMSCRVDTLSSLTSSRLLSVNR
jgi:hypothetical protein